MSPYLRRVCRCLIPMDSWLEGDVWQCGDCQVVYLFTRGAWFPARQPAPVTEPDVWEVIPDRMAYARRPGRQRTVPPTGFCAGCPDHEACLQGACHLNGGPNHPTQEEPAL